MNVNTALTFLDALETVGTFAVQIIAESEQSKATGIGPQVVHGAAIQVIDHIKARNEEGFFVGVTVNATDGQGRTAKNITRVRALFIDADSAPIPSEWPLQPSIVVHRDELHWHAYWLLADELPLGLFPIWQKSLAARFGTDHKVCDLPRVMRLPGSLHWKTETPIPVQLTHCDPSRRYHALDLMSAFDLHDAVPTPPAEFAPAQALAEVDPAEVDPQIVDRARRYLSGCPESISGQRGHDALFWAARALVRGFLLPQKLALEILKADFNPRCKPAWSDAELQHKIEEAATVPFGRPDGWLVNATTQVTSTPPTVPLLVKDLFAELDIYAPLRRVTTGFKLLDEAVGGGIVTGGFAVVAGLTGRGKSSIMRQAVMNIALAREPVTLYGFEDDLRRTLQLMVAARSGLPVKQIEHRRKMTEVDADTIQRVDKAKADLCEIPLFAAENPSDLPSLLRSIEQQARLGCKVFVIDQSSWVNVPEATSPFDEAGKISRALKVCARSLGVVIIALVQVNRAGAGARAEGKRLELFHLRDSGRFEQDADVVLLIQEVNRDRTPGELTLEVAKNRHGRVGDTVTFEWHFESARITDVASQKAAEEANTSDKKGSKASLYDFVDKCLTTLPEIKEMIFDRAQETCGISRSRSAELLKSGLEYKCIERVITGPSEPHRYKKVPWHWQGGGGQKPPITPTSAPEGAGGQGNNDNSIPPSPHPDNSVPGPHSQPDAGDGAARAAEKAAEVR